MSKKYKIDNPDTEKVDEMNIINNDYDHCIFINAQLWLTSHYRSTVVLLDTGAPGTCTSREIFSEDADGETQTRNPLVINKVL